MSRGPVKRQTLSVLKRRGIPVQTVIDVGVLTGTPELMEAYPDRMHLLFEPVQEFTAAIEQAYQNIPHVLVRAAASDWSGTTLLSTTTMLSGFEISHSSMTDDPTQASRTVRMVSLDDYLADHSANPPYLLKVDVDGHEMKVLRGARATLRDTSIVIVEATITTLSERVAFLSQSGFLLFDLTEPCYYDESLYQCDAVFVRQDVHSRHFLTLADGFEQEKYTVFDGR